MYDPGAPNLPPTNLPGDFEEAFNKLSSLGWQSMPEDRLKEQAMDAINDVIAEQKGGQKDLGVFDDAAKVLRRMEAMMHARLCSEGKLRSDLRPLIMGETGSENIERLAELISLSLVALHPSFNVSRVLVYLVFWVTKVGLDAWCAIPHESKTS
jgi:hypothetical protein